MKAMLFIFSFSLLAMTGCSGQPIPDGFHYDVTRPIKINKLPNELAEISGLALHSNQKVYCVQDEKGTVFVYNLKKNKIKKKIPFGKDNDFEGIAKAGEVLYVMKSNGTLYKIKNPESSPKKMKVKKITTFLNEEYDCEGICYDEKNNQLLIVCKDRPNEKKTTRHIFRFDLEKQKLKDKPYFKIKIEDLNALEDGKKVKIFNPSGIAIHPITNEIYVISSQGNALIVINEEKEITHCIKLKESLFSQPEGITFDSSGTMYISNEGHGKKATIKSFEYINN